MVSAVCGLKVGILWKSVWRFKWIVRPRRWGWLGPNLLLFVLDAPTPVHDGIPAAHLSREVSSDVEYGNTYL